MGDRGNVCIRESTENVDNDVYLYTHWRGSDLPVIVQEALAKKQRWDDAPYLARIVFDHMTEGDRGETGFGISASLCDPENPTVVIDTQAQTVAIVKFRGRKIPAAYDAKRVPIADYIKAVR